MTETVTERVLEAGAGGAPMGRAVKLPGWPGSRAGRSGTIAAGPGRPCGNGSRAAPTPVW